MHPYPIRLRSVQKRLRRWRTKVKSVRICLHPSLVVLLYDVLTPLYYLGAPDSVACNNSFI